MTQVNSDPDGSSHVRLRAGTTSSGSPAYEVVPAQSLDGGEWELLGTPALAQGAAAGDILQVAEDGDFVVLRRGGNVGVVAYTSPGTEPIAAGKALQSALGELGRVEVDPRGRWCVATLPVTVGFHWLEEALEQWSVSVGGPWSYTNVYDEQDRPLDWWLRSS